MISVTDHDTTAGLGEGAGLGHGQGIKFVAGIEMTAVADGRDVHVLGCWAYTQ